MQTRRDQLHAYRFMTRRAMSALVTGEPDSVEPPMRRLTVITISGIMIAIVVAAVFAVIGILKGGGGDAWREEGSVIVEEETGARFVMIDGKLHPAVNYASAVLSTGASKLVEVHHVPRSDLDSVQRSTTIGIPGLPDSMPSQEELVRGPVTVCSQAEAEGVNVSAVVHVQVGGDSSSQPLDPDEALYVESFDGERFLLFQGRRHLVSETVEPALQITQDPVKVGSAFLTAIPVGTPFETPSIDQAGSPTEEAGRSMLVGQVIEVDDGTFRVVLPDGIATITDVQAKLLRTAKLDGQRRDPVPMSLSDVLDMRESDGMDGEMEGLPSAMPSQSSAASTASGACVVFDEDSSALRLAVPTDSQAGTPTSESDASKHGSADDVSLSPGVGLIASTPASNMVYLIGEPGEAYPAQGIGTLASFGYDGDDAVEIPAELLGVIPHGDALDPARARLPLQQ